LVRIAFPIVKEYSWSVIFQGKSYIGEIRQLDFEEEKIFAALPYTGLSEPFQCLFMSVMDFGKFLLQHYDHQRNSYWAHEMREMMIAFLSKI